MEEPLVISIVGAGVIASTHARVAMSLDTPTILRVTDPDSNALAAFLKEFPDATAFDTIEAMLAAPAGPDDIVVVATPPFAHASPAVAALRSGRHVLCEKPLAMSVSEADSMLAAARENDRLLGCCSARFRDVPSTLEVKRLVAENAIGDVYHVTFINRAQRRRAGIEYQPQSRWFLDPAKSGGGILMDWGPYDTTTLCELFAPSRIDVCDAWMASPVTEIDPQDIPCLPEQHVGACLRFHAEGGRTVPVTYERSACTHANSLSLCEVTGTRGSIRWDWTFASRPPGHVQITRDRGGSVETLTSEHGLTRDGLGFREKPLVYFYRATRGKPASAIVNEQAIFQFSLLPAIYECAREGQTRSVMRQQTGSTLHT